MNGDQRLRFIELRRREIMLSRAMFAKPNDVAICRSWLTTANQVDAIFETLDPEEQKILEDLGEILRTADAMLRRPQDS